MVRLYYTNLASLICLIGLTLASLIHVSQGQDLPIDYLAPHNAARADVSVPPLTWNAALAAFAEFHANDRALYCNLTTIAGPYIENQARSSSTTFSVAGAVELWISGKEFYDYESNSCVGGSCLSYTQVVWRNTTDLGCARVTCSAGGTLVVCSYFPPGNVIGERPY